jgi:hypothetical protein
LPFLEFAGVNAEPAEYGYQRYRPYSAVIIHV